MLGYFSHLGKQPGETGGLHGLAYPTENWSTRPNSRIGGRRNSCCIRVEPTERTASENADAPRNTSPTLGLLVTATLAAAMFGAPAPAQNATATITLELLAAQSKLEEAASKGDTAYFVDAVSDDMLFVHRVGWITGGTPQDGRQDVVQQADRGQDCTS